MNDIETLIANAPLAEGEEWCFGLSFRSDDWEQVAGPSYPLVDALHDAPRPPGEGWADVIRAVGWLVRRGGQVYLGLAVSPRVTPGDRPAASYETLAG